MEDWITTTNPPGIWVWSSGEWKWYPPPKMEAESGPDVDRAFKEHFQAP